MKWIKENRWIKIYLHKTFDGVFLKYVRICLHASMLNMPHVIVKRILTEYSLWLIYKMVTFYNIIREYIVSYVDNISSIHFKILWARLRTKITECAKEKSIYRAYYPRDNLYMNKENIYSAFDTVIFWRCLRPMLLNIWMRDSSEPFMI